MAEIRLLETGLINRIAAGEVVERPASVVKELAENSIDAGASAVTVEIEDGGTTLIRVTDNGCGIEKRYVKQAFLRHATSKISEQADLDNILTLGFRGEALSSISSVSQLEIVTKTQEDITGIRIELEGGTVTDEHELGCAEGTTIIVRNLFFNTPARRKFLKKQAAESGFVSEAVTRLILAHPEISFKYINNGTTVLQSGGNGDIKSALFSVYGRDLSSRAVPVSSEGEGYRLDGYVIRPEFSRANRIYQNFFINGRYIKSGVISRAVEDTYRTRLLTGKFPAFALYLTTSPSNVDVNVHPAKLECRFENEEFIYGFVRKAVESALAGETLIPAQTLEKGAKLAELTGEKPAEYAEGRFHEAKNTDMGLNSFLNEPEIKYNSENNSPGIIFINPDDYLTVEMPHRKSDGSLGGKTGKASEESPRNTEISDSRADEPLQAAEAPPFFYNYRICGQVFSAYWIIEQNDSMYLIDQHAAHERILFEELRGCYKRESVRTQPLLEPVAMNLTEGEAQTVRDNISLLEKLGFELEEFGGTSFALRAVPDIMKKAGDASFFNQIIDRLSVQAASVEDNYDLLLDDIASESCRAAVKAGDRLGYSEAKALIERLLTLENPFNCPHGRPTIIELSKYEIEKKFRRVL